ncbi:spondin domain-containing protein [Thalassotalea sp. PLHSN55]|uniref:spondin domain-containing protein n=1 Tax=Thalassotalea sp. PLHSN55 TaxID=3435888 RepID=UPI003F86CB2F
MKTFQLAMALGLTTISTFTSAQQLEISITNLTQGLIYTPILVGAHTSDVSLFNVGEAASAELQAMAEGGDISGLATMLTTASADIVENPASGMLMPGTSTTTSLMTADTNTHLSITTMLLPTNDGFVGLNAWPIPTEAGTYTVMVNAYDAGTEANDEIVNGGGMPGVPGIPGAPGGDAGTGGTGVTTTEANETVHIHRGSLGDDDLTGGKSDLDSSVHRWLNPVARVTVTVM